MYCETVRYPESKKRLDIVCVHVMQYTIRSLVTCTKKFKHQELRTLPTYCIYVLRIVFTVNVYHFPLQQSPIGSSAASKLYSL